MILAGRRQSMLDQVTAANPGMHAVALDAADPVAIREFSNIMREQFPDLNV